MLETVKEHGDLVLLRNKRAVVAETLMRCGSDTVKLYGEVTLDEIPELAAFLNKARQLLFDKQAEAYAKESR